jgi:hypothetical protein
MYSVEHIELRGLLRGLYHLVLGHMLLTAVIGCLVRLLSLPSVTLTRRRRSDSEYTTQVICAVFFTALCTEQQRQLAQLKAELQEAKANESQLQSAL